MKLSLKEVAIKLNVEVDQIRYLVKKNFIPHHRLGGKTIFIDEENIDLVARRIDIENRRMELKKR